MSAHDRLQSPSMSRGRGPRRRTRWTLTIPAPPRQRASAVVNTALRSGSHLASVPAHKSGVESTFVISVGPSLSTGNGISAARLHREAHGRKLNFSDCESEVIMSRGRIKRSGYLICALIGCAVVWGICAMTSRNDEVVLTLGEPYEQVRQQSRSTLPELASDNRINLYIRRPAALRFSDPQYGFVTPAAKFLSIYADKSGTVTALTLSPQADTLPFDEAMIVFIGLQDQLRRRGWKPFRLNRHPPIEDTRDTRAQIRHCAAPTSYWQAGNNYQISLNIRCFRSDDRPNDERYLITLDLGAPVFGELPSD